MLSFNMTIVYLPPAANVQSFNYNSSSSCTSSPHVELSASPSTVLAAESPHPLMLLPAAIAVHAAAQSANGE